MSSSRLHSRLPLKLTGLQTTPVALLLMPCESGGDIASGEATGDQFDPSKSINHKASETLTMALKLAKLTCPSPTTTTTGARGPRFHVNWRRGATVHRERPIVHSQTGKAQAVPFAFPSPTPTPRQSERTTSLQSLQQDDNGTPATWTFGLVFQRVIDRQDRTTD